ncbi:MAG: thiosulfate oxidation carrier protein SoxY [Armatimonadota bacterium]|nr:thiosulfate oxidation carrier protein SoxY [Armatimonadota bacterium]MDR5702310.1 thiosulfate oxidation carrier protein SoxY [Armatimonadota bacterium]
MVATFPSSIRLLEHPGTSVLERQHFISVRMPILAHDGANVPISVEMEHPMEPEHYIRSVAVYVFEDPLVTKGVFSFSPHNGRLSLSFQFRMNAGDHRVFVVAECSRHGKWATSRPVRVAVGGCHMVGAGPGALQEAPARIGPPRLWVPERIRPGEIFEVRVKATHPSRTGLRLLADGRTFVRAGLPVFLQSMEVFYGAHWFRPRLINVFTLTSVLSDDPLFIFPLRADQNGLLRIVFTNHRGQRFEVFREIRMKP